LAILVLPLRLAVVGLCMYVCMYDEAVLTLLSATEQFWLSHNNN